MSFFGFDTSLPKEPRSKNPRNAPKNVNDGNKPLNFDETYRGYGEYEPEESDYLNAETFGADIELGTDFDFGYGAGNEPTSHTLHRSYVDAANSGHSDHLKMDDNVELKPMASLWHSETQTQTQTPSTASVPAPAPAPVPTPTQGPVPMPFGEPQVLSMEDIERQQRQMQTQIHVQLPGFAGNVPSMPGFAVPQGGFMPPNMAQFSQPGAVPAMFGQPLPDQQGINPMFQHQSQHLQPQPQAQRMNPNVPIPLASQPHDQLQQRSSPDTRLIGIPTTNVMAAPGTTQVSTPMSTPVSMGSTPMNTTPLPNATSTASLPLPAVTTVNSNSNNNNNNNNATGSSSSLNNSNNNRPHRNREPLTPEEKKRLQIRHAKVEKIMKHSGLMTPRDKDFITRYQLSQIVTEDPYNEDFYFQVYKIIQRGGVVGESNKGLIARAYLEHSGHRLGGRYKRTDIALQRMQNQVERAVTVAKERPLKHRVQLEKAAAAAAAAAATGSDSNSNSGASAGANNNGNTAEGSNADVGTNGGAGDVSGSEAATAGTSTRHGREGVLGKISSSLNSKAPRRQLQFSASNITSGQTLVDDKNGTLPSNSSSSEALVEVTQSLKNVELDSSTSEKKKARRRSSYGINIADLNSVLNSSTRRKFILSLIETVYEDVLELEANLRSGRTVDSKKLWEALHTDSDDEIHELYPLVSMLSFDKGVKIMPRIFNFLNKDQKLKLLQTFFSDLSHLNIILLSSYKTNPKPTEAQLKKIDLFQTIFLKIIVSFLSANSNFIEIMDLLLHLVKNNNVSFISTSKIGLNLITVLISRAALIRQDTARSNVLSSSEISTWNEIYDKLFTSLESRLAAVFPPREYIDGIVQITKDGKKGSQQQQQQQQQQLQHYYYYDQAYIWQFLASLALSGKLNHQRIIIDEIRDEIFDTINLANSLGSGNEDMLYGREKLYQDLNLFLNVMGLVARDGEITELK